MRKNPAIPRVEFEFIDDVINEFVDLLDQYMRSQRQQLKTWHACIDISDLTPDEYGTAMIAQKRYDVPMMNGEVLQGYLSLFTTVSDSSSICLPSERLLNLFKGLKLEPQNEKEWEQLEQAYNGIKGIIDSGFVWKGQLCLMVKTTNEINLWKHLLKKKSPQLILFKQRIFDIVHHELIHMKESFYFKPITKSSIKYNKYIVKQFMRENSIEDIDFLELQDWSSQPYNPIIYYNHRPEVRAFLSNIFWQLRDRIVADPNLLDLPVDELLLESPHYFEVNRYLLNKNKKLIYKATTRWLREDLNEYLGKVRFLPIMDASKIKREKAFALVILEMGQLTEELAYLENLSTPDESRIEEIEMRLFELTQKIKEINES